MIARRLDPRHWPLRLRVPIVTALAVLAVSAVITEVLIDRLTAMQERDLRSLFSVYLDAVAASVTMPLLADDPWESFDALDRSAASEKAFPRPVLVVVDRRGSVVASSEPKRFHTLAPMPDLRGPDQRTTEPEGVVLVGDAAFARWPLTYQGRTLGAVLARFDMTFALRERRAFLVAAAVLSAAIAAAAAMLGYVAVTRMLAPIGVLSSHFGQGSTGAVVPIGEDSLARQTPEFRALFGRFNAMARAVDEREALAARLADEERLASLGRLASGMAHEINNPLGGLFAALDTLTRHDDEGVRSRALALLQRGLAHIRDVVRSALVAYRDDGAASPMRPRDLDDLRLLVEPELDRKGIVLGWRNDVDGALLVHTGRIRQAVLNLLLNASKAVVPGGAIRVHAFLDGALFVVDVLDDGPGMPPQEVDRLVGSGPAESPPLGHGLGLWIVRRLVSGSGGRASVDRMDGLMTRVRTEWPILAHGDRAEA